MLTIQDDHDMKIRLFKVEYPKPSFADQVLLEEISYNLPNFTNKENCFRSFLESVEHKIKEEIESVQWIKGEAWHGDMLLIKIEHNTDYYKISHFS